MTTDEQTNIQTYQQNDRPRDQETNIPTDQHTNIKTDINFIPGLYYYFTRLHAL